MNGRDRRRATADANAGSTARDARRRDVFRRTVVGSLAAGSVGVLAGCLGGDDDSSSADGDDADGSDDDAGDDEAERDPAFGESATADLVYDDEGLDPVDACDWEDPDLVAHDVADTPFVVVPSFPAGWEPDVESFDDAGGELRYGDPTLRTDDGRMLTEIYVRQSGDTITEEDLRYDVDAGISEEVDPVELGGKERMVTQLFGQGAYRLAAPSPVEGEYYEVLVSGGGPDGCGESVVDLSRVVVDALVPNPETTV